MAAILVTGSDGQLGNELKVLSKNFGGYDFVFTDVSSLDLTDPLQVNDYIKNLSPGWIINCAAYNFVDKAESEPDNALKVNGTAVKNLADAIHGTTCKFIHISSDYVYDGVSAVPYSETSVPDPQSAYGRSKLAGEKFALSHHSAMVIRTSWLYSSFGNNFVKTMMRLGKEKEKLPVVFDQTGTPTYAADLAGAIMHIVAGVIRNQLAFNPGIYNYSNEGACTWFDFATEIMLETGSDCKVIPVLSSEFRQAAKRPSYSVLDKSKIKETYNIEIPHWRQSFKKCIKLLK
jgi:dTDP-4-dehydrorhamnose reductase